jgi:cyclohexanecarboxyl-CoA dehydrogenase
VDFAFSDEEKLFAETLRQYARNKLKPEYQVWDAGTPYPREKLRELASMGITGLRVPEAYGGIHASYVMAGIAAEELARGDYNTTLFLQLSAMCADIVVRHGSEAICQEWLPRIASGESLMALGLTEPGAGSDAAAIKTSAKREGDYYVIQGEKASITFAGSADACVLFARTSESERGARGISSLLVPLDIPGVSRQVYRSPGERLTRRGSLIFDGARVPTTNLLGAEGTGFAQALSGFDYNRALIALACIGAAQESLEETVEYAKQRATFGRPLAEREGVSFQIAEHLTLVASARLLAYQCLALCDRGERHSKEGAMAKWLGPKVAVDAIHACIILHGWMGYSEELPYVQRLRDVIGLEIGDGTPEIMKGIIARETFGRGFMIYK